MGVSGGYPPDGLSESIRRISNGRPIGFTAGVKTQNVKFHLVFYLVQKTDCEQIDNSCYFFDKIWLLQCLW